MSSKHKNKIEDINSAICYIKKQNNICGICKDDLLDENKIKEELISTNCKHIYHTYCSFPCGSAISSRGSI